MLKHFRKLLAVFLLAGSSLASAVPCVSATLSDYVAYGTTGCTLFDGLASNFVAPLPGQTVFSAIAPSSIIVTPIGNALLPGFSFALNTSTAERLESFFRFSLQGISARALTLTMAGAAQSGDGSVSVVADSCSGGSFDPTQPTHCSGRTLGPLITLLTANDLIAEDTINFAVTSFFDVFVDITLDGAGQNAGTASFESASLQFAAVPVLASVPVPTTSALVALALLALAGTSRRRHSQG